MLTRQCNSVTPELARRRSVNQFNMICAFMPQLVTHLGLHDLRYSPSARSVSSRRHFKEKILYRYLPTKTSAKEVTSLSGKHIGWSKKSPAPGTHQLNR